jgi:hypothetical protein
MSEVGIGLRRNLTMTIAMIVTMSLSLALFGSGLLLSKQIETMKDFWYDRVEVSVYLCGSASSDEGTCGGQPVTEEQRQALLSELEAMPAVQEVFYESQEDAYQRFREQFADSPDLVENVTAEALPRASGSSWSTRSSSTSSPAPSRAGRAWSRWRTRRRCWSPSSTPSTSCSATPGAWRWRRSSPRSCW